MSAWFRSLFVRKRRSVGSEAFTLGQQAGGEIAEDALKTTDGLLGGRRLNFLAVLGGRLSAISDNSGVTYHEQAQIELKIMLENWSERMSEQKDEIWNVVSRRWPQELVTSAPGELREIIGKRVEWHYTQLFSEGLEHAADAVAVHNHNVPSGRS